MASRAELFQKYKLETIILPPDKLVHRLNAFQSKGAPGQILYKQQPNPIGGGGFGTIHLQLADSDFEGPPRVRAVKQISKEICKQNNINWEYEVQNLSAVANVSHYVCVLKQCSQIFCLVRGPVCQHVWLVRR
jgi:hypothetical protein